MRKVYAISIFLILAFHGLYAQDTLRVLGKYNFYKTYYFVSGRATGYDKYEVTISNSNSADKKYTQIISPMRLDFFKEFLFEGLDRISEESDKADLLRVAKLRSSPDDSNEIKERVLAFNNEASVLYYNFLASFRTIQELEKFIDAVKLHCATNLIVRRDMDKPIKKLAKRYLKELKQYGLDENLENDLISAYILYNSSLGNLENLNKIKEESDFTKAKTDFKSLIKSINAGYHVDSINQLDSLMELKVEIERVYFEEKIRLENRFIDNLSMVLKKYQVNTFYQLKTKKINELNKDLEKLNGLKNNEGNKIQKRKKRLKKIIKSFSELETFSKNRILSGWSHVKRKKYYHYDDGVYKKVKARDKIMNQLIRVRDDSLKNNYAKVRKDYKNVYNKYKMFLIEEQSYQDSIKDKNSNKLLNISKKEMLEKKKSLLEIYLSDDINGIKDKLNSSFQKNQIILKKKFIDFDIDTIKRSIDKDTTISMVEQTSVDLNEAIQNLNQLTSNIIELNSVISDSLLPQLDSTRIQQFSTNDSTQLKKHYLPNLSEANLDTIIKQELNAALIQIRIDTIMLRGFITEMERIRIISLDSIKKRILKIKDTKDSLKQVDDFIEKYEFSLKLLQASLKPTVDSLSETKSTLYQLLGTLLTSYNLIYEKEISVEEIEIEFFNGFIENIQVIGELHVFDGSDELTDIDFSKLESPIVNRTALKPEKIKFENYAPIGFSRKRDFQKLQEKKLLFGYTYERGVESRYKMNLGDFFPLINEELAVRRRDYSPKNQRVKAEKINFSDKNEHVFKLKKETTSQLFEARVYSDFLGFQQDSPNGIIQTEVSKFLHLATGRFQWKNYKLNIGLGQYIEPFVIISKLEDSNKGLPIKSIDRFTDGNYDPIKYVTTLNLKQRESFSTGFNFNIVTVDIPVYKSTVLINFGFAFGITPTIDTLKSFQNNELVVENIEEFSVNTMTITPFELKWEINTDERYGFNINARVGKLFARTNRFVQVGQEDYFLRERNLNVKRDPWYTNIEFGGYLKPSAVDNTGQLFFRYKYFWQHGFWREGFSQIQMGYSFYILKRNSGS